MACNSAMNGPLTLTGLSSNAAPNIQLRAKIDKNSINRRKRPWSGGSAWPDVGVVVDKRCPPNSVHARQARRLPFTW